MVAIIEDCRVKSNGINTEWEVLEERLCWLAVGERDVFFCTIRIFQGCMAWRGNNLV